MADQDEDILRLPQTFRNGGDNAHETILLFHVIRHCVDCNLFTTD